jgi:hypothetical protein
MGMGMGVADPIESKRMQSHEAPVLRTSILRRYQGLACNEIAHHR